MTNKITFPNVILLSEVREILKKGVEVTFRTKGNSMLPFIHGGQDSVRLVGSFSPQKGDIVLAQTPQGNFVLHRIIQITPQAIVLMGDGNLKETETCRREDVFGKVITILQNGKEVNPYSRWARWQSICWLKLLPIRKYLLTVYKIYRSFKN